MVNHIMVIPPPFPKYGVDKLRVVEGNRDNELSISNAYNFLDASFIVADASIN